MTSPTSSLVTFKHNTTLSCDVLAFDLTLYGQAKGHTVPKGRIFVPKDGSVMLKGLTS